MFRCLAESSVLRIADHVSSEILMLYDFGPVHISDRDRAMTRPLNSPILDGPCASIDHLIDSLQSYTGVIVAYGDAIVF